MAKAEAEAGELGFRVQEEELQLVYNAMNVTSL